MLEKKGYKIVLIIFLLLIIGGNLFLILTNNNYSILNIKQESIYNDDPIYIDHMIEFDVINSNYIEKYYERYIEYKKNNPSYSDDTVITYVNIGLDRPFYTGMESTNLNDSILLICNKYHTLGSSYVPKLVNLGSDYGGGELYPEAAENFIKMAEDAKKDKIILKNVSAYRTTTLL